MISDKIEQAKQFKEQGNEFFKQQEYKKALSNYHRVFLYLNGLIDQQNELASYSKKSDLLNSEEKKEIDSLKYSTHLNMSQVYIFQKQYQKGKDAATKSIQIKKSAKGLYRLGVCNTQLNNLDDAYINFKEAKELDLSLDISEEIQEIQKREKLADKNLAKQMKRLWT